MFGKDSFRKDELRDAAVDVLLFARHTLAPHCIQARTLGRMPAAPPHTLRKVNDACATRFPPGTHRRYSSPDVLPCHFMRVLPGVGVPAPDASRRRSGARQHLTFSPRRCLFYYSRDASPKPHPPPPRYQRWLAYYWLLSQCGMTPFDRCLPHP